MRDRSCRHNGCRSCASRGRRKSSSARRSVRHRRSAQRMMPGVRHGRRRRPRLKKPPSSRNCRHDWPRYGGTVWPTEAIVSAQPSAHSACAVCLVFTAIAWLLREVCHVTVFTAHSLAAFALCRHPFRHSLRTERHCPVSHDCRHKSSPAHQRAAGWSQMHVAHVPSAAAIWVRGLW